MLLTEYDEIKAMNLFKEEGRQEGRQEGRKEGRREGRREGRQEGVDLITSLMARLFSMGRTDDAVRAASDKTYMNQLIQELGLN